VSLRTLAFVIFAIAVSAGCVRLGFWQLHRLGERRASNAMLASRLGVAPQPARDVMRDSAGARFRRATARGVYDFANELALASRTRQGSPGVNIITPLIVAGTDTALLVNRGWVYAPDAMSADFGRWKEPDSATVRGYLLEVGRGGRGSVFTGTHPRTVRRLDLDSLSARLPYPVSPFLIVQTEAASTAADSTPVRVATPLLDEGPHLGYAMQWFAFALIGLVGAVFGVHLERRGGGRRRLAATPPAPRAREGARGARSS
jgi:surfeit locus 1 family protein